MAQNNNQYEYAPADESMGAGNEYVLMYDPTTGQYVQVQ